jgi:hypothetical protein
LTNYRKPIPIFTGNGGREAKMTNFETFLLMALVTVIFYSIYLNRKLWEIRKHLLVLAFLKDILLGEDELRDLEKILKENSVHDLKKGIIK